MTNSPDDDPLPAEALRYSKMLLTAYLSDDSDAATAVVMDLVRERNTELTLLILDRTLQVCMGVIATLNRGLGFDLPAMFQKGFLEDEAESG